MVTHSSALAWRIQGTGKPGRLPSMGLHRVGQDWSNLAAAAAYIIGLPKRLHGKESTCQAGNGDSVPGSGKYPGERNDKPLLYSCLGYPRDRGACQATVYGVSKSQTWLKQVSSSSSSQDLWDILRDLLIFFPSGKENITVNIWFRLLISTFLYQNKANAFKFTNTLIQDLA